MVTAYKVEFNIEFDLIDNKYKWSRENIFFIDSKWSIDDPLQWIQERINDYKNTLIDSEHITDIKITRIDNPSDFLLFH